MLPKLCGLNQGGAMLKLRARIYHVITLLAGSAEPCPELYPIQN